MSFFRVRHFCIIAIAGVINYCAIASAQQSPTTPQPKDYETVSRQIIPDLLRVLREQELSPESQFTGPTPFDNNLLFSRSVKFKNNAAVVFTDRAISNNIIYIVAEELAIDGEGSLGWQRRDSEYLGTPPARGKAPSGQPGRVSGETGHQGEPGFPGDIGYPGRSGPTVVILVGRITGGSLNVELQGEEGGKGGNGGEGGNGGSGAPGEAASQSLFDCKRRGQDGGDGGLGGRGGDGGPGGKGGNGGDVFLITLDATSQEHVKIYNAGGEGGLPGEGGIGGKSGPGGRAGSNMRPYCLGGQPGSTPTTIIASGTNPKVRGSHGIDGRYYTSTIEKQLLSRILNENH